MALDPVTAVLDIGGKLIDKLWPDPAQRDAAKLKMLDLQQTGELAKLAAETDLAKGQLSINQEEAKNPRLFVSGWRPWVGWICGAAFAYAAIFEPVARFVAAVGFGYKGPFPVIDTALTMQVLFGILGLGGLRTYEKHKQVAAK
jgi:hypothetical protein